jgi:Pvc16 N-terminal domain
LASYHAIAAIGQAILGLLEQARVGSEFDGFDFELYQAADFHAPMEQGLSLFLYNTAVSRARANVPARPLPDGRRKRPPLPLDLYYLLTPWAKTAVVQHRLLGWAMRVIDDTPTLPASLLNHYGPEADTFWPDETITLVNEPISLQDIYNIWEIHKQNVQVSVAYIARVLFVDSLIYETELPRAQTRSIESRSKGERP